MQFFLKIKKPEQLFGSFKWCLQESNQGHKDFQSFALPTELRHHRVSGRKYKTSFLIVPNKIQKSIVFLKLAFYKIMNLVIDIGNTKVKAAVFESNTIKESVSFEEKEFSESIQNLIQNYQITACIVSSVKKESPEISGLLEDSATLIYLDHQTAVPFVNTYDTPQTLGIDRIALVAAAAALYPNQNCLIIDAGTCITFDFINENSEYLGGAISPGVDIRYRSLKDYTSKLPRLSANEDFNVIGKTTSEAIHSGIINGVIQEIQGVIKQYEDNYPYLTVILTGGDTKFLFKQLKNSIFAHQNFLLYGLNTILTHNNKV